jgi:cytochrome b561
MWTRDSNTMYGSISRINHWLGALFVLLLLGIGLYFHEMPRGPEKQLWKTLHVAFGTVAIPFLLFRVFWRVRSGPLAPLPQPGIMQLLAKLVHVALLLCIVVLVMSGPLSIWATGRAFGIYGLLQIPSPFPPFKSWHEPLEELHGYAADGVLWLVIVHLAGVLKHQFFDRDGTLGRMTGRGR